MRNRALRTVDAHCGVGGKRLAQPHTVAADDGAALLASRAGQFERKRRRGGKTERRGAAAVERGACAAVHLRFKRHTATLEQNAAAAQTAELMRREAQGVDAGKADRNAADGLRCVYVQAAVRAVGQKSRDFLDRLHCAELAVHRADGNENRVRAQQLADFFGVYAAVAADGEQVDFPAVLLKCGQTAADRGMLEWGGDDVSADMARGLRDALDGEVVRLGRARGKNHLGGSGAGERCNLLGHARHFLARRLSGRMNRVRVGREAALCIAETLEHRRIRRGVSGIIKINHESGSL